jgi:hypothetical protein
MATPREELEELRALAAQKPRQELEELRQLAAQEEAIPDVPRDPIVEQPVKEVGFFDQLGQLIPSGAEQAQIAKEGILEPATAIASGIGGSIAGGLAGGVSAPFVGAEKATDIITSVQEFAAEAGAPTTQRGKESLKTVGELMQKGLDIANFPISGLAGLADLVSGQSAEQATETVKSVQEIGLSKTAGAQTLEATGDPLMATVVEMVPAVLGSLIPITKIVKKNVALKQKMADKIKSGTTDKKFADYMVSGAEKLKKDSLAIEAQKQGFDQSVIAAVKGSSKVDKTKMLEMVNVMKKGKENALFAMKNRPSDVAGNSLLERVNYIKKINREAGKQVDDAAKALKGQQINFDQPISNFMESLDEMGVRIGRGLKPNFKGSDIEGLVGPESAIKNIIKRLSSGKRGAAPDAHELHRMKRYIDEIVTYGKEGEGLKGKTERILKSLRRDLDDTLDSSFPDYNAANTKYADTVGALDALQDVAGKKMDLFGLSAEKATGTLLRRMMSNAQSRVNLVDAVDSLESISKKYGGTFADDISSQMLFADELDNVFGSVARTSFAGETAKGIRKGAEAVTGQRTISGTALEIGAAGIEKLRGINEEGAFKAIGDLLKREVQ